MRFFCTAASFRFGIAEELVPLLAVRQFFVRHDKLAQLPRQYPRAKVLVNTMPLHIVRAYQRALEGGTLPETAFGMLKQRSLYDVANEVASTSRYVAQPLASAEASYVTAYAMLKSAELPKVMIVCSFTG